MYRYCIFPSKTIFNYVGRFPTINVFLRWKYCFVFLTDSSCGLLPGLNSLCRSGWPWTPRDLTSTFVSQALRLKVYLDNVHTWRGVCLMGFENSQASRKALSQRAGRNTLSVLHMSCKTPVRWGGSGLNPPYTEGCARNCIEAVLSQENVCSCCHFQACFVGRDG